MNSAPQDLGGTHTKAGSGINNDILAPVKSDEEHWYKSFSGMEYKYDLSRPRDKILYDLDIKAKMYDEIKGIDPRVEMDRSIGQFGGGIRR